MKNTEKKCVRYVGKVLWNPNTQILLENISEKLLLHVNEMPIIYLNKSTIFSFRFVTFQLIHKALSNYNN